METNTFLYNGTTEKLLFRRQFVLAPCIVDGLHSWNHAKLSDSSFLVTHPDLEVYRAVKNKKSVTLIGYMLDPYNNNASNSEIVKELLTKIESCVDIFQHTTYYGGRWVLIVSDGYETILLNDAAGLREVYYTSCKINGQIWIASLPGLIAEILKLEIDKDAMEFVYSREANSDFNPRSVTWWPGDTSMYKEIKIMLPNHYLNYGAGEVHRYWPSEPLGTISLEEALKRTVFILKGLLESANKRFDMSISLTAGWDSRIMLALCRDIIRDIYCFTRTYPDSYESAKDVTIPSFLLNKIGMKHNIIRYPEQINAEFQNVYKRHSSIIGNAYCADVQSMYEHLPKHKVCITGDVAEIVKCHYIMPNRRTNHVAGHDLASLIYVDAHPFVTKAFEKWLPSNNTYNFDLLDIFCWEQFVGRLQARNQADQDIVHESFTPFNCRKLLTTILSIDKKYRKHPEYIFFKMLIDVLWDEMLSVPINPRDKFTIKGALIDYLVKIHIYSYIPESAKRFSKRIVS